MSKVIDIDAWREARVNEDKLIMDAFEDYWDEFERERADETVTHLIVAADRTGPDFLELREELDREGKNYTVVSKKPTREFDL